MAIVFVLLPAVLAFETVAHNISPFKLKFKIIIFWNIKTTVNIFMAYI